MGTAQNIVEETFDCEVSELFDLVTTPANWLGLHPVTKGVYGPSIEKSLTIGGVAIEHIVSEEREKPLDAVWLVTDYIKDKLWLFESIYFGGENCKVVIRYDFKNLENNKVLFKRTMMTTYYSIDGMSISEKAAFKSTKTHSEYFENIKKKLHLK